MTALYLMVAVCLLIAALLWAVIRGGKREVEAEARASAAEKSAEVFQKTIEDVIRETPDTDVDDARERMRSRAKRKP